VDDEVAAFLRACHHCVFNLEGALTERRGRRRAGTVLGNPRAALEELRRLGCTGLDLANNHTMDCGDAGLEDTLGLARDAGIATFGAGTDLIEASRPAILEHDGIRVAVLGLSDRAEDRAGHSRSGVFWHGESRMLTRRIEEARESCDWLVACHHGGEEYTAWPSPGRRDLLLGLLDRGIDLIVGHHPHVVQAHEIRGSKRIYYSLGNFIFDHDYHRHYEGTEGSVLLGVEFDGSGFSVETLRTRTDRQGGLVRAAGRTEPRRLDPRTYGACWRADAFRVYQSYASAGGGEGRVPDGRGGALRWLARKLVDPGAYVTLARHLGRADFRPVFLAAMAHLLERRLRPGAGPVDGQEPG
jgi:poly-gamma-glutamate synthesis protein (capsule biosynthesis protein)